MSRINSILLKTHHIWPFQLKLTNREKQEAKMRLDRLDIQKENLRLERDMLKKDLNEVNAEKSGLQVSIL